MAIPYVNITMVTMNRLPLTCRAVESLLQYTHGEYQLTIVDNYSTDGTRQYLAEKAQQYPQISVKFLKRNMGVAVAANLGWSSVNAPYYVKLDNDIELQDAQWLEKLITVAEKKETLGQVGHRVLERLTVHEESLCDGTAFYEADCCNGACVLIPDTIHKKFGFWNEDYGLYGFEDLDYSNRLMAQGYAVGYASLSGSAVHLGYSDCEIIQEDYEKMKKDYVHSQRYGQIYMY